MGSVKKRGLPKGVTFEQKRLWVESVEFEKERTRGRLQAARLGTDFFFSSGRQCPFGLGPIHSLSSALASWSHRLSLIRLQLLLNHDPQHSQALRSH